MFDKGLRSGISKASFRKSLKVGILKGFKSGIFKGFKSNIFFFIDF